MVPRFRQRDTDLPVIRVAIRDPAVPRTRAVIRDLSVPRIWATIRNPPVPFIPAVILITRPVLVMFHMYPVTSTIQFIQTRILHPVI